LDVFSGDSRATRSIRLTGWRVFLQEFDNRNAYDVDGSSQTETLFHAKTVPRFEGQNQFDCISDIDGCGFDFRQPAAQVTPKHSRRTFVFFLKEMRAPALKGRGAKIGCELAEDRDATIDQRVHPFLEGPCLDVVDEKRSHLGRDLFVHGREERLHVGEMSEYGSDPDFGAFGDLLSGGR